jgi:hypothetical protein
MLHRQTQGRAAPSASPPSTQTAGVHPVNSKKRPNLSLSKDPNAGQKVSAKRLGDRGVEPGQRVARPALKKKRTHTPKIKKEDKGRKKALKNDNSS